MADEGLEAGALALTRELKNWRRAAEAARLKSDAEGAQALSKEELERLRSLGYIQ
jgi:hypothetical protein